jgi:hypothetical protein
MNFLEVWEDFLRDTGHETIHWSRIGDIRADNDAIMAWAREHGHVVFTHDLDFGSLMQPSVGWPLSRAFHYCKCPRMFGCWRTHRFISVAQAKGERSCSATRRASLRFADAGPRLISSREERDRNLSSSSVRRGLAIERAQT